LVNIFKMKILLVFDCYSAFSSLKMVLALMVFFWFCSWDDQKC
jgi:hypothetical protein